MWAWGTILMLERWRVTVWIIYLSFSSAVLLIAFAYLLLWCAKYWIRGGLFIHQMMRCGVLTNPLVSYILHIASTIRLSRKYSTLITVASGDLAFGAKHSSLTKILKDKKSVRRISHHSKFDVWLHQLFFQCFNEPSLITLAIENSLTCCLKNILQKRITLPFATGNKCPDWFG